MRINLSDSRKAAPAVFCLHPLYKYGILLSKYDVIESVCMTWWHDPEKFVDAVDIEKHGGGAVQLLRDLIVKRTTEYDKISQLFFDALSKPITLLPRQQTAIQLADEAKLLGITETSYISQKLGINRHSAYKLLRRAEDRLLIITFQSNKKMETYSDSVAFIDDTRMKVSKQDIFKRVKNRRVSCPTQPFNADKCDGDCFAHFGICRPCLLTFDDLSRYPDGRPDWVQLLINTTRKEAREQARQEIINMRLNPLDIHDVA